MSTNHQLSQTLPRLMNRLRQALRDPLQALEPALNPPDIGILGYIADHPGCAVQDVVQFSGRDKGQMTRKLKLLEQQGLLNREVVGNDARRRRLTLTQQGQTLCTKARRIQQNAMDQLFAPLNQKETRELLRLLGKCVDGSE